MEKARIYTKNNCPFCVKAKDILKELGVEIAEIHVGNDISREDFLSNVSKEAGIPISTVPQIFIDGRYIGGCDDLENHLAQTEVSSDDFVDFEL